MVTEPPGCCFQFPRMVALPYRYHLIDILIDTLHSFSARLKGNPLTSIYLVIFNNNLEYIEGRMFGERGKSILSLMLLKRIYCNFLPMLDKVPESLQGHSGDIIQHTAVSQRSALPRSKGCLLHLSPARAQCQLIYPPSATFRSSSTAQMMLYQ